MLDKNAKIYVAGHRGLVGSAIWKNLQDKGYTNLIGKTHKELDLLDAVSGICIPCRCFRWRHHGKQHLPCRLHLQKPANTAKRHR